MAQMKFGDYPWIALGGVKAQLVWALFAISLDHVELAAMKKKWLALLLCCKVPIAGKHKPQIQEMIAEWTDG